ncbi:MAG TPA: hypothetical protein VH083_16730 [Myxococcales bacterium]|nr:hypothetical protein [Myxococcales bacterium]
MLKTFAAILLLSISARAEERAANDLHQAAPPAATQSAMLAGPPIKAPRGLDMKSETSSFHVGAMMGLVSLPRPLDVEIYARLNDYLFIGFSYSDFSAFVAGPLLSAAGVSSGPTTVRLDQFTGFEGELRIFPFCGSFFLGSSFGHQSLKAAVTQSTETGPQSGSIDVTTLYATPRIGYLWTFGPGFTLGLDVGAQLKLSATRNVTLPPGASQETQNDTNNLVDVASNYPLPSFHLRLGWQY